jgi:hypothetical protein
MMVLIHLHTANMFCGELTMPLDNCSGWWIRI